MLVQFRNNWIQKIPLTAKLDSAYDLVQFWLSSAFFFIQLFPNWTACSPITYTNNTLRLCCVLLTSIKVRLEVHNITLECN